MYKKIFISCYFILLLQLGVTGQNNAPSIAQKLINIGFENIRIKPSKDTLFISIENNIYRYNIEAIRTAIDTITFYTTDYKQLYLYYSEHDIPRILIKISSEDWGNFNKGKTSVETTSNILEIDYVDYGKIFDLYQSPPINPTINKINFIIYPQFALQNVLIRQIYEVQLNIAPAFEVSLWEGMLFTGQVIFPLKNELGYEGDFIRPGFVTLSQEFLLTRRWFGRFVIGNFNANRYGADLSFTHPINNQWEISLNIGLTGSSYFYEDRWDNGEINTFTWQAGIQYFYPKYNLELDLRYGHYLNKDDGFRFDCTRHFKSKTIGFYAMYTGGEINGGFHFSIPLPPRKRKRRNALNLTLPKFFDWEYNAGTEFYYGRYYETRPNENHSERWLNPLFIKNEFLKPMKK